MNAPIAHSHACQYCDTFFTRAYNLKRHIIRIHKILENNVGSNFTNNVSHLSTNSHPKPTNSHPKPINSHPEPTNSHPKSTNSHPKSTNSHPNEYYIFTDENGLHNCKKCNKKFKNLWYLKKHVDKCNGLENRYECKYCNVNFTHKKSIYKHYKICKAKKDIESKSLIPLSDDSGKSIEKVYVQPNISSNGNTLVNCNHNNITNNTQNNTQNVNIIVYDKENMEFVKHHIDSKSVDRILKLAKPHINRQFVTEYSKQIFSNPENQCIKKGDLKSSHSEVHIGDDQWELDLDCNIYPKLACNMASTLSDLLHTKRDQLRKDFNKIIGFLDYIADEGYINTEDKDKQEEIFNEYKIFVKELKLIIYSATQKMKQQLQEQKDIPIE